VIVVHLVLHHVEQSAREKTVKELARVLKDGGRLVIMDPLGSDHGTPVEEIRKLMIESGLKEGKNAVFRWHLFVDAYQATWSKPPCSPVACEMPAMT
jgi:ubiquinone/menaquinone biosynthesis C-methylase UbiE